MTWLHIAVGIGVYLAGFGTGVTLLALLVAAGQADRMRPNDPEEER